MNTQEIEILLRPGIIGVYDQAEITEIFAIPCKGAPPVNVFTLVTAENRHGAKLEAPRLHFGRIEIDELRGWVFGIKTYTLALADAVAALHALTADNVWTGSGNQLGVGKLQALPAQFVPRDDGNGLPLNSVLKNNFWNGSYILEWADLEKANVLPLLQEPKRLQRLSAEIGKYLPIGVDAVSDRLGNFIFQLPSNSMIVKYEFARASDTVSANVAWAEGVTPRPVRLNCQYEHDGIITAFTSGVLLPGKTTLPLRDGIGALYCTISDDEHGVILAATGPQYFISSVRMNTAFSSPEPRIFDQVDENQNVVQKRVGLAHNSENEVGLTPDRHKDWVQKRLFKSSAVKLVENKSFIQYGATSNSSSEDRERAIADVRSLINRHGQKGAWLWDPFLSSQDLIDTLFYCSHIGADLRGLTAGQVLEGEVRSDFIPKQVSALKKINSNFAGMRLEFRIRKGSDGWSFHDRFLICPSRDGPANVWSLGTSVNSLGKSHHILQKVNDGQPVADAFLDLWNSLDKTEHLIWPAQ